MLAVIERGGRRSSRTRGRIDRWGIIIRSMRIVDGISSSVGRHREGEKGKEKKRKRSGEKKRGGRETWNRRNLI